MAIIFPVLFCLCNFIVLIQFAGGVCGFVLMQFYNSYIYLSTSPNLEGGRRGGITLGYVLTFVTGSDEEPVLGYEIHPSIYFAVAVEGNFLPTANVCINRSH